MTDEQRNALIDERLNENKVRMLHIEIDLVMLRLSDDKEMMALHEKQLDLLKQANEEIERMKVM